ncbi:MAG: phospholipase A [Dysgonomonas sp.]
MYRTGIILFIIISFSIKCLGQQPQINAVDTIPYDSVNIVLKNKTDLIIESVFKPTPELNNADSIRQAFDDLPSFGIYKNNYIVTGTAVGVKPTEDNSDAKFQISFMQRVTNSVLPFNTYLFITYTQLAYWDIYKESFPFGDINFNPTLGIGKVLSHNNRFLGTVFFQLEHESNGKDKEDSRSWNKISLGTILTLNRHWNVQGKLWIPLVDGENNKNIASYKGWGHFGVDYNNRRLNLGLLLTKRAGKFFDHNVTINFSYRIFKKENQHLFVEYYNGYGENLLFFNKYHHRIRIGFVIQPSLLRIY